MTSNEIKHDIDLENVTGGTGDTPQISGNYVPGARCPYCGAMLLFEKWITLNVIGVTKCEICGKSQLFQQRAN